MPELNIRSVKLLGSKESIKWEHTAEGLRVDTPDHAPNAHGLVYRIKTK